MPTRTERLRRMAALGMLTRTYAHEFNNVLGGILGSAQLLAMRSEDPDLRDRLGTIVQSVQRGMALTAALAQVTRSGRASPEQPIDLHALLATLIDESVLPVGTTVDRGAAKSTVSADGEALGEALAVLAATVSGIGPLNIATANSGVASCRQVDGLSGSAAWLRVSVSGATAPNAEERRLIEDPLTACGGVQELLIAGATAVIRQCRGRIAVGEGGHAASIDIYLPTA
jgi:hypothetical protein